LLLTLTDYSTVGLNNEGSKIHLTFEAKDLYVSEQN